MPGLDNLNVGACEGENSAEEGSPQHAVDLITCQRTPSSEMQAFLVDMFQARGTSVYLAGASK